MSKKNNLSVFEIVWYILTGAVAVWGLTYVVLGLVGQFYPASSENNPLMQANNAIKGAFGLGFLYWGLIILAIAVVCLVFVLCVYAKRTDREAEKTQRRAARLAAQSSTKAPEVVDAEVEPAKAE